MCALRALVQVGAASVYRMLDLVDATVAVVGALGEGSVVVDHAGAPITQPSRFIGGGRDASTVWLATLPE